jgi:hypothetical protein
MLIKLPNSETWVKTSSVLSLTTTLEGTVVCTLTSTNTLGNHQIVILSDDPTATIGLIADMINSREDV